VTKKQRAHWGVIFDVDGTMVDNAQYHQAAWTELGARYGKSITSQFYQEHIHAHTNDSIVRTLFGDVSSEQIAKISNEKEIIYRASFRPAIKEIPGLTNLLKALKNDAVPCAAASNSPEANVDMVLDELNLSQYLDVVINNDQVERGKPDPEIFLTAAVGLHIQPQRCVVFEDSISGFKAARRAKMPCIAITARHDNQIHKLIAPPRAYKDFTTITLQELKALADNIDIAFTGA
jgi:beta-phosphoglucomutase family hydrolase